VGPRFGLDGRKISSPRGPVRSQSLHRLSYRAHMTEIRVFNEDKMNIYKWRVFHRNVMTNSNVSYQSMKIFHTLSTFLYEFKKNLTLEVQLARTPEGSKMHTPERASLLRDTYVSYLLYFNRHLSHDFSIAQRDRQQPD